MASALRRLGAARPLLTYKTPAPPSPRPLLPLKQPGRFGSYLTSPDVTSLTDFTEYEVVHRPAEWSHVENLLFRRTIPRIAPKEEYPSGWSPPKSSRTSDLPYCVGRSCNHMIPVYLNVGHIGLQKITKIKHVMGDIELLEKEIRDYLQKKHKRVVATCINECGGIVRIKGDYCLDAKKFLENKGF